MVSVSTVAVPEQATAVWPRHRPSNAAMRRAPQRLKRPKMWELPKQSRRIIGHGKKGMEWQWVEKASHVIDDETD
jgi:hypothetical protein